MKELLVAILTSYLVAEPSAHWLAILNDMGLLGQKVEYVRDITQSFIRN
ncbi:MAG: hypothetical protein ABI707_03880 [Ferruginibacter sp.]